MIKTEKTALLLLTTAQNGRKNGVKTYLLLICAVLTPFFKIRLRFIRLSIYTAVYTHIVRIGAWLVHVTIVTNVTNVTKAVDSR